MHTKYRLRLELTTPYKDTKALTSYGFVPLLLQCRTTYAAVHTLVLLKMGIIMPETCWGRCLIINIRLVASCWFLSLHPTFLMHGQQNIKKCVFKIFTFIDNLHLVLCTAVLCQSDEALKDSNNSWTTEVSGPDIEANSEIGNHFRRNIHCTILRNKKETTSWKS